MANNNPFGDAFKAFDAFRDYSKQQFPAFDYESFASAVRQNIETIQEANQAIAEGIQAVAKRQAEILQANTDNAFLLFKEIASSSDPKESAQKQAEFAKSSFEKASSDASELIEIASSSNKKAAELISAQVENNLKELNKSAKGGAKKAEKKAA